MPCHTCTIIAPTLLISMLLKTPATWSVCSKSTVLAQYKYSEDVTLIYVTTEITREYMWTDVRWIENVMDSPQDL